MNTPRQINISLNLRERKSVTLKTLKPCPTLERGIVERVTSVGTVTPLKRLYISCGELLLERPANLINPSFHELGSSASGSQAYDGGEALGEQTNEETAASC